MRFTKMLTILWFFGLLNALSAKEPETVEILIQRSNLIMFPSQNDLQKWFVANEIQLMPRPEAIDIFISQHSNRFVNPRQIATFVNHVFPAPTFDFTSPLGAMIPIIAYERFEKQRIALVKFILRDARQYYESVCELLAPKLLKESKL